MRPKGVLAILLIFGCSGCASTPLRERYGELDGETKAKFLAYYPLLTNDQRLAWLDNPASHDLLLKKWDIKIAPTPFSSSVLEISPEVPATISSGKSVPLRALLGFPDGRKLDVTQDVRWQVQPSLARVRNDELVYDCAFSEVEVSANFLEEKEGRKTFRIHKSIQGLEFGIADSWTGLESARAIRLKAIARCEDGSSSDVSCQAEWRIPGSAAQGRDFELRGCGNLHYLDRSSHRGENIAVEVFYGGKAASSLITLP